jgi:hypothetical protein
MSKTARRSTKVFVGLFLVAMAGWLVVDEYCSRSIHLGQGVSKHGILKIKPGMSERKLIVVLGSPLEKRVGNGTGSQEDKAIWVYGKPGRCWGGLEISVLVVSGIVEKIGIEQYDALVYRCDREHCPVFGDEDALELADMR